MEQFEYWDLWKYREMAIAAPGVADSVEAPFAYRVAGPWLVGITPLSVDDAFYVWTILWQFLNAALFYTLLRSYINGRSALLVTSAGFVLTKNLFIFLIFDYFQLKDAITLAGILGVLLALRHRKVVIAGFIIAAVTPFSESIIVGIPVIVTWIVNKRHPRRMTSIAQVGAPLVLAIAVPVILRVAVESVGPTPLEQLREFGTKIFFVSTYYNSFIFPYVPLVAVLAFYVKPGLKFFRKEPHLPILVVSVFALSMFGANVERLMLLAAPAVFILIGLAVNDLLGGKTWVILLLFTLTLVTSQHHIFSVFSFPSSADSTKAVSVIATIGVFLVVTYVAVTNRHQPVDDHVEGGSA